jgi:two-component system response regulator ResD
VFVCVAAVGAEFQLEERSAPAGTRVSATVLFEEQLLMRILHVEDDEDTRKLVECILHGRGWQVVSVENATSAFKLAAAGGFDLYLIDNWIEGDTDNALCRGLRSLDPHTPILFYSGAVFPADVTAALASGAQGYLEKPCTPDALIEEILKLTQG